MKYRELVDRICDRMDDFRRAHGAERGNALMAEMSVEEFALKVVGIESVTAPPAPPADA